MPKFYSPKGNLEVWAECPEGYVTPEEYLAAHPLPELSFDELKASKIAEIANARYMAETGGVTFDGVTIATDRQSQSLLTAAYIRAQMDAFFTVSWKTADNTFVDWNAELVRAAGNAVLAHVEACFAKEKELLALIEVATTKEELNAISW